MAPPRTAAVVHHPGAGTIGAVPAQLAREDGTGAALAAIEALASGRR
ncbi:hypothetical protein [Pseudonocardia sp. GCM10023141]